MYISSRNHEYLKEFSSIAIDTLQPILYMAQRELMQILARKQAQSERESSLMKAVG